METRLNMAQQMHSGKDEATPKRMVAAKQIVYGSGR
jgi:hypothetical protein